MPELPEVETTVRELKKKVLNRTFVDVWTDAPKIIKKPPNLEDFKKELKGKKILDILRIGKNIIFRLSNDFILLIHQKLTGHLLVGRWQKNKNQWVSINKNPFLKDPINCFIHLILFLDNREMIALSDMRKFAKVELWPSNEYFSSSDFKSIGPDPLNPKFSFEEFKERLKRKKGKIKEVLMDQRVISGVGNIYSSEALWYAKIHPLKETQKLTDEELKELFLALKKVLRLSIKLGGESFSDYRKTDGSKGGFDKIRKVYQREGEKCLRCGDTIKRIKIGQRSTFFCPHCQNNKNLKI